MEFFVDSNIIIEGLKNNKKAIDLLYCIRKLTNKKLIINEVVWSEVVYQLVVKRKLDYYSIFNFLRNFDFLIVDKETINYAEILIERYKLKPNDALILAACKHYNIPYLLSL